MCGRFVSASTPDQIASYFDAEGSDELLEPSYNVAPTDPVYAVLVEGGVRRLTPLHWGLVPLWAKDPKIGARMINARAETLATKGAFKDAFARRRCIVPADGFYEWKALPGQKKKQPMYVHRPDGEPFAFGGLWERWRNPDDPDQVLRTCTIVTGEPNEKMAEIHDRMPLILPPDRWADWLDPTLTDLDVLTRFLVPAPAEVITYHPVSGAVGSVKNNSPELMAPVEPATDGAGGIGGEVVEALTLFDHGAA